MEIVFAHLNGEHQARPLFEPEAYLRMMRMLGAYEVGHAADGSPLRPPPRLAARRGIAEHGDAAEAGLVEE